MAHSCEHWQEMYAQRCSAPVEIRECGHADSYCDDQSATQELGTDSHGMAARSYHCAELALHGRCCTDAADSHLQSQSHPGVDCSKRTRDLDTTSSVSRV